MNQSWSAGIFIFIALFLLSGCKGPDYDKALPDDREPLIEPDYSGVTIPVNVAPLNFELKEKAETFFIRAVSPAGTELKIRSKDGLILFPLKKWKNLLSESVGNKVRIEVIAREGGTFRKFLPFYFNVSGSPVDPYLCYRLLYPGYESWVDMKIVQRSTESFRESSVVENQLLNRNCINCHSFLKNEPDNFLIHVRGDLGGTYFSEAGKLRRVNLRTANMPANAVYPAWHPAGKFVTFSSNKTVQSFHMLPAENIEVADLYSSLLLYDVNANTISPIIDKDTIKYMETFPCWSSEGDYLYYCRARQPAAGFDYREIKYDLVRRSFNSADFSFGPTEMVFNASAEGKSVSFPAVSPEGNFLVFTLHGYGTFSIWHKDADLYLIDLRTMKASKMELNSDFTESYHSWSSNGKWLVFSSKRMDGLTARPFFSHVNDDGSCSKPFVLPQKDPSLYSRLEKTFNRPELIKGRISSGPRDFMRASEKDPLKAQWK